MLLFRSMSQAERYDISDHGFRSGRNSLEGKWFAESFEHAKCWGELLYNNSDFIICKLEISDEKYFNSFRLSNLDGVGPAVFVDITNLKDATVVAFDLV